MKTATITMTVFVAFTSPSLAKDSLHLLATVATMHTDDATQDLHAMEIKQKAKSSKLETQLNCGSVNPIVISRDRALNN